MLSAKCYIPNIIENSGNNDDIAETNNRTIKLRKGLNLSRSWAKEIDEDFAMTIISGEMQGDAPWAEIRTIGSVTIESLIKIANLFVDVIGVELYCPDRKPVFRKVGKYFGRLCFVPEGKKVLIVNRSSTIIDVITFQIAREHLVANTTASCACIETVKALKESDYDLVIIDPFGLPSCSNDDIAVEDTYSGHRALEKISESSTPFIICAGLNTRQLTKDRVNEFEKYNAKALLRFWNSGMEGLFTAIEKILTN